MERFFLDIGFSWTLSKSLPFILMLVLGVLLFYIIRRKVSKRWIKISSFALIPLPIIIYFLLNPIYEGDFSNNYSIEQKTEDYKELKSGHLAIITIPNCPYCYEALDNLKVIKGRIGSNAKLDFIVCSTDTSSLDWYKEESSNQVNFSLAKNPEALMKLAGGTFPCFAFVSNSGEIRLWSNDGFGVMAKDWVEDKL